MKRVGENGQLLKQINMFDTGLSSPDDSYFIKDISNNNELIISHDLGLYHYTYSSNSLITIESGHSFTKLVYDRVNSVLYCVEGSDLFTYDLSGNQLDQLSHSDVIDDVLLFYNK